MGVDNDEDKPPLHVFFDIEAMQDTNRQVANLLIAETENNDQPEHFRGENCVKHFLEWLDTLTENDTRPSLSSLTILAISWQMSTTDNIGSLNKSVMAAS